MIKNECKIVKDLLPNYVEDLISKETKEFVENHIEACKDCKGTLDLLKGDQKEEKQKEERGEEEEIKHLKKYNRRMTILKSIAVVLALFIVIALPVTLQKKIKEKKAYDEAYAKGKYAYDIIQVASSKLKELEKETNIEISKETVYDRNQNNGNKSKIIYKFKDEKINTTTISYGKDLSTETKTYEILSKYMKEWLEVTEDGYDRAYTAYIKYSEDYYQPKGYIMNCIDKFDELSIIDCSTIKVRDEEHEGKKCYVLRYGTEDVYKEIWIDKETNYILRNIHVVDNRYFNEEIYTFSVGTVTDENMFDRIYKRRNTK